MKPGPGCVFTCECFDCLVIPRSGSTDGTFKHNCALFKPRSLYWGRSTYEWFDRPTFLFNYSSDLQNNQLDMAVFFWYLVKSDWSSVRYCTSLHWTSHSFKDTRKIRPRLTGHSVSEKLNAVIKFAIGKVLTFTYIFLGLYQTGAMHRLSTNDIITTRSNVYNNFNPRLSCLC